MNQPAPVISDLQSLIEALPENQKSLCRRIFAVSVASGTVVPPPAMIPWIESQFGSLETVADQTIVKVTNLITFEGSIFNTLRGVLSQNERKRFLNGTAPVDTVPHKDAFDNPIERTTADVFGRVEGKYSITASNIAKFDGFHSVVIFKRVDPLNFTAEEVADHIDTGWRWAQEAHRHDPKAQYFSLLWNSGKRAGASMMHGHAHLALGRDMHYAKTEALRRAALSYRNTYGTSYFDDLFEVYRALGLGFEKDDTRVFVSLSPIREKETVILAPGLTDSFKQRVYDVLACFRDKLDVLTFNVGIAVPPLGEVAEDWTGFPIIARIVDRGYPNNDSSDFGSVELFAASVIHSDPFEVARTLKKVLSI
jgi:hypothetical protein